MACPTPERPGALTLRPNDDGTGRQNPVCAHWRETAHLAALGAPASSTCSGPLFVLGIHLGRRTADYAMRTPPSRRYRAFCSSASSSASARVAQRRPYRNSRSR